MATETVSQRDVQRALDRLTRVQGILMCASERMDGVLADVGTSNAWSVSEALRGALDLLDGCYSTLVEAVPSMEGGR